MKLAAGDKLGPYEILGLLGSGGMGEGYRAHDDRLRRDVAVKVSNAEFTERFTQEARAIASLNHTNICHLYDVGPNYLVMELVEGETLKGPLAFDDALPIVLQLIDGIEAAHEKNIIHRDLKPANVLVNERAQAMVTDFGLAAGAGLEGGTPAYMAPEQWRGEPPDVRTDIYAFGCILYELFTLHRVFAARTEKDWRLSHLNERPYSPRAHRADPPAEPGLSLIHL